MKYLNICLKLTVTYSNEYETESCVFELSAPIDILMLTKYTELSWLNALNYRELSLFIQFMTNLTVILIVPVANIHLQTLYLLDAASDRYDTNELSRILEKFIQICGMSIDLKTNVNFTNLFIEDTPWSRQFWVHEYFVTEEVPKRFWDDPLVKQFLYLILNR